MSAARPCARPETWLWLANALGFGGLHAAPVLEAYPNPELLVEQRRQVELSQLLTPAQRAVLEATEPEDFTARADDCARLNIGILCYDSPQYPALLRQIPTPPPVLYYRGDVRAASAQLVFAMVGTRRPSAYGIEATRALAAPLAAAGAVLVSGLATGLDSESHKAAVKVGTPTIACMAFGHDMCYPAANRTLKGLIEKQGLVLSEYPPGTQPQRQFFLQRNRLIAGLSHGLCVAEARASSGTMHTVGCALEFGRDVFSVPGSIFSPLCEGTNQLLRDGAVPAVCAGDILRWYGLQPLEDAPAARTARQREASQPQPLVSAHAACVKEALLAGKAQDVDTLSHKTNLAPRVVMAALTELELAGMAVQQAGRQFLLKE